MRVVSALLLFVSLLIPASAASWPPVDPADLAATAPKVQTDAHAEAILWDIRVADELTSNYPHTIQSHYLKIKIFDQRGVEMLAKVDVLYPKGAHISDIAARTTKRNGEVLDMKKDAVFDRVLVKGNGIRWQAKSFALPGLEPGAVVEYGWTERHEEALANYVPVDLQREIPVQTVVCHLKPLVHPWFPFTMRTMVFQTGQPNFRQERNGFSVAEWKNMPAFREEPDMPAERSVRSWLLVYYEDHDNSEPEKYWKERGRHLYGDLKPALKVDKEVRSIADELTGKGGSDEEKLQRLYQFCRTHIRNINGAHSGITPEQRTHFKDNNTPRDTLRQEIGTSRDIEFLFAALATAAGYDARMARAGDRSYGLMDWRATTLYFLPVYNVAVRLNDKWLFVDPGVASLPFGMLRWQEEGAPALVTDPKDPVMTITPVSTAKQSALKRTAKLTISEEGTLEGDIRIEQTGHLAIDQRSRYEDETDEQIAEALKDDIKDQFGEAELTDFRMENLTDPEKPFVTAFHLKVAAYGQRTGKRLFFQPAVFEKNKGPRYATTERKYAIQFRYRWSENDQITIQLPPGYELDHADIPARLEMKKICHYIPRAQWTAATRTFTYSRDFAFGEEGGVVVPEKAYPTLKSLFDTFHDKDAHVITAKQTAATTAAN